MSRKVRLRIGLVVEIRRSNQEIHEVRTGLAAVECKPPVKLRIRMDIDLINDRLEANLDRMLSDHPGEAVARGVGIVRLREIGDGGPHDKAQRAEIDVFDALDGRGQWENTLARRRPWRWAIGKTLRSEARPDSASGLPHVVVGPHIAQVELIHAGRTEGFRVAEVDQLRRSQIQAAESGDRGAPLPSRKWVVHEVVVIEEVCRKLAPARAVAVDAAAGLVVAHRFDSAAGEGRVSAIRRGNVLQQLLCGSRPGGHGKYTIRKNALRVASAPRTIIHLAGRNRHRLACGVGETFRELGGKTSACNVARRHLAWPGATSRFEQINKVVVEVIGIIQEIARALGIRRDRDIPGGKPLGRARSLVVSEEKYLALRNRSAQGASELVLTVGLHRWIEKTLRVESCVAQKIKGFTV